MKKILILAYVFPPYNHISAQRPKSFAENFSKYGLYPIVVTRQFNGTEKFYEDTYKACTKDTEITEQQTHTVIRIPYFGRKYQIAQKFNVLPYGEKMVLSVYGIFGSLNAQAGLYECAINFLKNYLNENPVDYILVTSPPLNIIKLGYKLSKKFNIPLIVDFRDLWDINLHNDNYQPSLRKVFQNFFEESYLKIWLERAKLITGISEPLLEVVQKLTPKVEKLLIMNGFEKDVFAKFSAFKDKKNSKFTFSVVGTIYPQQDLTILLEGMKIFLDDKNLNEIQLNFIGTAFIKEVGQKLAHNLPQQCTNVTDRLPREKALQKLFESDVLFFTGWKGYRGVASGKLFEYLGSKKKVLIAPSDNDIMESLVLETGAGKVANSAIEFANIMNEWFNQWKSFGKIPYTGDYEKVLEYSRENQAAKLVKKILSL